MERKAKKKRPKMDKVELKKLFRFQSFSERIANIKIDVTHRLRHTAELPKDHETFFGEALQKWKELNCTVDFIAFQHEVRNLAGSLPQLLHHKDQVTASLKKYLLMKNSLSYEPLLDLLVQLARDLQSDFYPHFQEFFSILVSVCNVQDADFIQNVFNTLAYLFKFLWRHMLKDIENVYNLYSKLLLQSQKPHIRQFAVESFGFLLRKVRNQDRLFTMILNSLENQSELTEGVGQLLFEVCKGVPKQFHSCTETLLPLLLSKLGDPDLPSQQVLQCLTKMIQLMAEHTRREHSEPVWTALLAHLTALHSSWRMGKEEGFSETLSRQLAHTLHLVGTMVAWRRGSRVAAGSRVTKALLDILSESDLPHDVVSVAVHLAASLVLVSPAILDCQPLLVRVVEGVCGRVEEVELVLEFFQEVAEGYPQFQEEILPMCLQYCESAMQRKEKEASILSFLCDLCLHFDPQSISKDTSCSNTQCFEINLEEQLSSRPQKKDTSTKRQGVVAESAIMAALQKCLDSGLRRLRQIMAADKLMEVGDCLDDEFHHLWASLVCLQHIRPVSEATSETVKQLYTSLREIFLETNSTSHRGSRLEHLLLTLGQTIATLVATLRDKEMTFLELEDLMAILRDYPSSIALLRSIYQYVRASSEEFLTADKLVRVLPLLQQNLSSPSSPVRLLTLRVLCSFEQLPLLVRLGEEEDGSTSEANILKACLQAEEVPAELESYRKKLLCLEKLKYRPRQFQQLPELYREVPLRYLIGMLYVNFRLVWEPVSEIIRSYAVEQNTKLFWNLFGKFLEGASDLVEGPLPYPPSRPTHTNLTWHHSTLASFQYQSTLMTSMEQGWPDHTNFRMLLWKCVGMFSEFAEPRSRILIPLVFRFLQNEFSLVEDNLREFQDLRWADILESTSVKMEAPTVDPGDKDEMEQEGSEGEAAVTPVCDPPLTVNGENFSELETIEQSGGEEEEEEEEEGEAKRSKMAKREVQPTNHVGGRNLTKTLLTMLTLFSKFHNPKAFYKQEEIWQLFLKLLTHRDSAVQQLAIACLMTYKPPYLLPYRENFERLLDDTLFRTELENFSVDSECSVVSEEHRVDLAPILVRLLYGRMQRQGGHSTTKSGGTARRGIVLRFLGGCQERELAEFISLLLVPFKSLLGGPQCGHCSVEISRVIPLKKQQGFVTMLGQLLPTLGSKVTPYLETLFSVLLKLGASCARLLKQRALIQPHFVNALKVLRQLTINRVAECFDIFTNFDFTPFQEDVLQSIVWPQLLKLPQESIQHPTPLMKLLHTCTQYPRYFHLLSEPVPPSLLLECASSSSSPSVGQPLSRSILHYVFRCLFSPGVSQKVCSCIMEMVINLLCAQELEKGSKQMEELEEMDIEQDSCTWEMMEEDSGEQSASLFQEKLQQMQDSTLCRASKGMELVLPFIPVLLEYLSSVIQGNEKRSLQLEFSVLSKISSCVKDPNESEVLIALLLPFLLNSDQRFKKYEEDILLSISSLVAIAGQATDLYRPLSQLFSVLGSRRSRNILCDVFQGLAKKDPYWSATVNIVVKLNAWDEKHIEEPAYEIRLAGFSEAKQALQNPRQWSVNSVLPVLHNAMFFLLQCEDMSIRDAAASYVTELITHIQLQDTEAVRVLVLDIIVSGVKQGIRSKYEFARHESISLLSHIVKAYPTHPRFTDMTVLTHKDPEVDFFENIRHIQLHRRTKALRRLAEVCAESSLTQASIMTFLLPLASQVVFTPSTNVEQNLVAEAVNVIRTVSSQLRWTSYCFLLRHYLRQLPKRKDIQKSLIKAVVAILDAFHFDLSEATSLNEREQLQASLDRGGGREKLELGTEKHLQKLSKEEGKDEMEGEEEGGDREEGEEMDVEQKVDSEVVDNSRVKQALAQKIHKTIVSSILPSLQAVLTKRVDTPGHKLSRVNQDEQSEILRVPVAMAMTKLLLALPESTLHTHLPSLLLKVCQTLKNRARNVRDIARDTLVKMAAALGPRYLPYIIREMKELLTRGYQLHVLAYSLHSVLNGVSTTLKTGDLDPCRENISQILIEDLFGVPAEERASDAGVARIPESKAPQSFGSYEIVARFLSPGQLPDLLDPVKAVLEARSTLRVSRVVEEVFRRVALGIQNSEGFTPQALLVFIHNLISNSIPQLAQKPPSKSCSHSSLLTRPDSYLLPPTPTRAGPKPVTKGNVAAHIVTEFGLQLLHAALKHSKFDTSEEEQLHMLDPFVPLLSDSLTSHHLKVLCRALHCLTWVIRLPLPSLDANVHTILSHLFDLLRRYSRTGAAVGSNRELVLAAFKAMTVVLRDFKRHEISEDELKLLLSFVEEDIHDYQRQSTAFPLLKTILGRKLIIDDMYELMHKVAQLSVSAESEHVRQQSRQAVMQFIMDYPLDGKKLNHYLDFYITNLNYEEQSGRESVIELLAAIFNKFPERLIHRHASYFFIPLASQLINDESPTCRQMVAEAVKTLIGRLDTTKRNDIVNMIELWIAHDKLAHKRLGVQTLGLMVEVEGQAFEKRLGTFLPLLLNCLRLYKSGEGEEMDSQELDVAVYPGAVTQRDGLEMEFHGTATQSNMFSNDEEEKEEDEEGEEEREEEGEKEEDREEEGEERLGNTAAALDHLLFSTLSTLEKICGVCSVIRVPSYHDHMNHLWEVVQLLLLHPHAWVRLSSCRLFGLLFASYKPEEVASPSTSSGVAGKTKKKKRKGRKGQCQIMEYMLQDSVVKVQDLCGSFCTQLSSPLLNSELANQSVKNLVFLAKVLHRMELAGLLKTFEDGDISRHDIAGSAGHAACPSQLSDQADLVYQQSDHPDQPDQPDNPDHPDQHDQPDQPDNPDHPDQLNQNDQPDYELALVECRGGLTLGDQETDDVETVATREHVRNLHWLIGRLSRLAKYEAGHHPKEPLKRTAVLQWVAAVSLDLGEEHLGTHLPALLQPVYREVSDVNKTAGEGLYTLAQEVLDLVKGMAGREMFSKVFAQVHQSVLATREKRRKQAALEAVANPEKSVRRKQRKNLLKKASKRRKIATYRPAAAVKKIKLHH